MSDTDHKIKWPPQKLPSKNYLPTPHSQNIRTNVFSTAHSSHFPPASNLHSDEQDYYTTTTLSLLPLELDRFSQKSPKPISRSPLPSGPALTFYRNQCTTVDPTATRGNPSPPFFSKIGGNPQNPANNTTSPKSDLPPYEISVE